MSASAELKTAIIVHGPDIVSEDLALLRRVLSEEGVNSYLNTSTDPRHPIPEPWDIGRAIKQAMELTAGGNETPNVLLVSIGNADLVTNAAAARNENVSGVIFVNSPLLRGDMGSEVAQGINQKGLNILNLSTGDGTQITRRQIGGLITLTYPEIAGDLPPMPTRRILTDPEALSEIGRFTQLPSRRLAPAR